MEQAEFSYYLQSGVKKFFIRFENSWHYNQFKQYLVSQQFKVEEILEASELKTLVLRPQLFSKSFFIAPYESSVWQWAEKQNIAVPFLLKAKDARTKAQHVWEGPSDPQILAEIRKNLEAKGCRFAPDGWKRLVDHFSSNGKLRDPEGLSSMAYSVGLQAELVNLATVNELLGGQAQIYELFNALVAKDKLNVLRLMFGLVTDREAVTLSMGLSSMLCKLASVAEARDTGLTHQEYAVKTGWHPYRCQKLFEQAVHLTPQRKIQLWDLLYTLEIRLKSSQALKPSETFKRLVMQYLERP